MSDARGPDANIRRVASPEALAALRTQLETALAAEVAHAPDQVMVLSSEHCHSRLVTHEEVGALHALLRGVFDDVRVVVYLRRQDRVAVSHYSTHLKGGGTRTEVLPSDTGPHAPYFDFEALLERWASVFGESALTVRLFEPSAFPGGSVVHDFCQVLGFAPLATPRRANESLDAAHQEFLRRMNAHVPRVVKGDVNPEHRLLTRLMEKYGAGQGRRPARAHAEAFYRQYADGNEAVRRRWFPERDRLFEEDFSSYPEVEDPPFLSDEDAFRIMAEAWLAAGRQRDKLRKHIRAVEAKLKAAASS